MHRKSLGAFAICNCVVIALFSWTIVATAQTLRPFTVRDSIELARFDNPSKDNNEEIRFGPDGHNFFVITKRGFLSSNETESTIWVFDGKTVLGFVNSPPPVNRPSPRALVRMSSSSNGDPITHARWSIDGQTITFVGSKGDAEPRLYAARLSDERLQQLSPNGQNVSSFDQTNTTFVFTAAAATDAADLYQAGGPALPDVQVGTGLSLFTLLFPKFEEKVFGLSTEQVWRTRSNQASRVTNTATTLPVTLLRGSYLTMLSLSPSGRYVVAVNNVAHVPPEWEAYEPAASYAKFIADDPNAKPALSDLSAAQYVLIDLQLGRVSPLTGTPLGFSAAYYLDALRAKWSKDENKVVVSNTFVPLNTASARPGPTRPCVATVDLTTHFVECVRETPGYVNGKPEKTLSDVEWRESREEILVRYIGQDGDRTQSELFQRHNGAWTPVSQFTETGVEKAALSVAVQQSVNSPPVLVATDLRTGNSKTIWNPNPQLLGINLGEADVYHWRDKSGHQWTGGLVKPTNYNSRHRYPLVIQTHGFDPGTFLTDGSYSTANAARALAARGIVVLQVAEPRTALFTSQDAEIDGRFGYESAIKQLAAEGIINPKKVGIIGFSHTGIYVLDSLIHLPDSFAAATLAECSTDTLGEYLINADYRGPQTVQVIADLIGGKPFGDGLKMWESRSPGFNTDKFNVPLLFEENSPPTLVYSWDLYAALRLQSKPVELLYMRNGEHILKRPAQVFASQEMNVDWYDFWLNGHEDRDPAKAPQYARWRNLRASLEHAGIR
jgi:dipeptidyl aminopeptidase/acylaminoacyl peptidase